MHFPSMTNPFELTMLAYIAQNTTTLVSLCAQTALHALVRGISYILNLLTDCLSLYSWI